MSKKHELSFGGESTFNLPDYLAGNAREDGETVEMQGGSPYIRIYHPMQTGDSVEECYELNDRQPPKVGEWYLQNSPHACRLPETVFMWMVSYATWWLVEYTDKHNKLRRVASCNYNALKEYTQAQKLDKGPKGFGTGVVVVATRDFVEVAHFRAKASTYGAFQKLITGNRNAMSQAWREENGLQELVEKGQLPAWLTCPARVSIAIRDGNSKYSTLKALPTPMDMSIAKQLPKESFQELGKVFEEKVEDVRKRIDTDMDYAIASAEEAGVSWK